MAFDLGPARVALAGAAGLSLNSTLILSEYRPTSRVAVGAALTECGYRELLRWEMVFVNGRCRST